MKNVTKTLKFFTRISGFFLIGVNLLRLFDQLQYLDFMQAPMPALFNSFVLLIVSYLPRMLKALKFEISDKLYALILTSIAFSLTGGLIFELYQLIPGYDSLMHFINGGLLTLVGFSAINMFEKTEANNHLSPFFIVLFAFSLAMMIGVVWEIFEYAADGFFGANMQRYADIKSGVEFVGRQAIADTMKDLILNTIGALIISYITYFDIKKGAPYLQELLIKPLSVNESIEK